MRPPFKLPVRIEDGCFLVAADHELIQKFDDATPAERAFIAHAINCYDLLSDLRGCCELNLDDGYEPETTELLDKVDAALCGPEVKP